MNYARAIKLVRASKGLSQKDLAKKLKVDSSFVSLLEKGKRCPSMATLESIAGSLNVPIYLIMLLASEKKDLKGLSPRHAGDLGNRLLELVVGSK
jgi:transcriptional regulator with XRE-family HTH domain